MTMGRRAWRLPSRSVGLAMGLAVALFGASAFPITLTTWSAETSAVIRPGPASEARVDAYGLEVRSRGLLAATFAEVVRARWEVEADALRRRVGDAGGNATVTAFPTTAVIEVRAQADSALSARVTALNALDEGRRFLADEEQFYRLVALPPAVPIAVPSSSLDVRRASALMTAAAIAAISSTGLVRHLAGRAATTSSRISSSRSA